MEPPLSYYRLYSAVHCRLIAVCVATSSASGLFRVSGASSPHVFLLFFPHDEIQPGARRRVDEAPFGRNRTIRTTTTRIRGRGTEVRRSSPAESPPVLVITHHRLLTSCAGMIRREFFVPRLQYFFSFIFNYIYYIILYYIILYYIILYYTVLYYIILYYTVLYYTVLYCIVLYYTIL